MINVNWQKALRSWVLPTLAVSLFSFMLGFAHEYYAPRLESLVKVNIEELSREHTPLRVFPDQVKVSLLPPRIELENVRIIPQNELRASLAPLEIKNVKIDFSMLSLLRGAFRVGELSISGAEISYIHKRSTTAPKPEITDLSEYFKLLIEMPLDFLQIENINIFVQDQAQNIGVNINNLKLSVENSFQSLLVDIEAPELKFKKLSDEPIVDIGIETKLLIRETRLQVSSFKVKKNDSFLVASGSLYGSIPELKITDYAFQSRTHLQVDGLAKIAQELGFKADWPTLAGIVNFDISAERESGKVPVLRYKLETQDFSIAPFDIGNISTKGDITDSEVEIESLVLENNAGKLNVKSLKMNADWLKLVGGNKLGALSFNGKLEANQLELRKLLVSVGAGDTPLHFLVNGSLDCSGTVLPTLITTCKGSARGSDFKVWSNQENGNKFMIAEVDSAEFTGETTITSQAVTYKSSIKAPSGVGNSEGTIDYAKGFNINYEGEISDFAKMVRNLANLKLEGAVSLKGNVQGDSKSANFEIGLKSKDTWFEDYGLGDIEGRLRYKSGTLTFPNFIGSVGLNKYQASVAVNLLKEKIFFEGKSDRFEATDAVKAFSRKVTLPFSVTGLGKVNVKGQGPLQFNRLSYDFDLSINQASIFDEPFESVRFQVESQDGMVNAKNVRIKRGAGTATFTGVANQNGIVNGQFNGDKWALDAFETFKDLGLDINGDLSFNTTISDHILNPTVTFLGQIRNTTLNDSAIADSKITLSTKANSVSGELQLFGGNLFSLFSVPFSPEVPYSFYVRSKDFDFTKFFSTFSSFAIDKGFEGALDGELRFSGKSQQPKSMRGSLNISNFQLRRGSLSLKNPDPMKVQIENGVMQPKNFELVGNAGFIKILPLIERENLFDLELNSQLDVRLLNLIFPFLEELRGNLSLSSKLSGQIGNIKIRGNANLENGYIKIKDFPHYIDRLKSEMTFNESELMFNSITAKFANGTAFGEGSIEFKGNGISPVRIDGKFTNIQVEVPKGFKSEGSGTLSVTGDQFPYVLGLNYDVQKASVNKDLDEGRPSTGSIRPSAYLPKNLNPETFVPFVFNLDIDLERPANVAITVSNIDVQTTARGSLRLKGPLDDLRLTGRLTSGPQGRLAFRNNVFELNAGWLDYNNSPPDLPRLYFAATTRISNTYDVSMLVQGVANNPGIELSSSPSLPEHEIISLLALGVTSRELDDNVRSEDQATKTSIEVGSALIRDQLGLNRNVEDTFGVRVDISSAFDETSQESVPAVTIRKDFTPKFGLSGTRTLGDNQVNKLKAEVKLNRNFSVIGQFENQNIEGRQIQRDTEKVGLDFEYRFEFK